MKSTMFPPDSEDMSTWKSKVPGKIVIEKETVHSRSSESLNCKPELSPIKYAVSQCVMVLPSCSDHTLLAEVESYHLVTAVVFGHNFINREDCKRVASLHRRSIDYHVRHKPRG